MQLIDWKNRNDDLRLDWEVKLFLMTYEVFLLTYVFAYF